MCDLEIISNTHMYTTVMGVLLHYSTLYCAKGNYEFGISRVIKSLEPYSRKVRIWNAIC